MTLRIRAVGTGKLGIDTLQQDLRMGKMGTIMYDIKVCYEVLREQPACHDSANQLFCYWKVVTVEETSFRTWDMDGGYNGDGELSLLNF